MASRRVIGAPLPEQGLPDRALRRSLTVWRGAACLAAAAAVLLAGLFFFSADRPLPVVTRMAVLVDADRTAVWLVRRDSEGMLALVPLQRLDPPPGRAFELWLVPGPYSVPESLGLLPGAGRTVAMPHDRLVDGMSFAVTLESSVGSLTGRPTPPIVYSGSVLSVPVPPI
jgi:anti-sigma-K factor RskA